MSEIHIHRVLGNGAFGMVYYATLFQEEATPIAIKIISKEGAESSAFLQRLRDEAKLLALLDEVPIIKVLGACKIRGLDSVLLEFVDGLDLHKIYQSSIDIPINILCSIGAKATHGLHLAHTAQHPETSHPLNVIHRDIKPGNIMLTRTGEVKICDFGIAKAAFELRESRTGAGEILGTKAYIAPEYVIRGQITPAADIYALGLSILQLCLRQDIGELKLTQREHEDRINNLLKQLPPNLVTFSQLLSRMISWNPALRPNAIECQHTFERIGQNIKGETIKNWSLKWIPILMQQLNPPSDILKLVNVKIQVDDIHTFNETPKEIAPIIVAHPLPTYFISITAGILTGVFFYSFIFSILFSYLS